MDSVRAYLFSAGISLFLTLLIEGLVALPFRVRRKGWLLILAANLLTNPIVVSIFLLLSAVFRQAGISIHDLIIQLPLELIVIIAEANIYCHLRNDYDIIIPYSVFYAIIANLISYGCGLVMNYWFL